MLILSMGQADKASHDTSNVPRRKRRVPSVSPTTSGLAPLNQLPVYLVDTTWRVAVPILVFSIGGYKLDQKYSTDPWLTIIGVILSVVFATLLMYRFIKANFPELFGGAK